MKMIIDIPDDVYGHIKSTKTIETVDYDIVSLYRATKNGTLVSTDGDLISREALKIEIEKQIAYCDDKSKHQSDMEEVLRYANTSYGLRLAHNYIVNAPTVEPKKEIVPVCKVAFDKEQLQEIVDKKVAELVADLERPQDDLIKAFELLKAHCKNRECNKDCVFYRELHIGKAKEDFCGLCEIVTSDERGKEE